MLIVTVLVYNRTHAHDKEHRLVKFVNINTTTMCWMTSNRPLTFVITHQTLLLPSAILRFRLLTCQPKTQAVILCPRGWKEVSQRGLTRFSSHTQCILWSWCSRPASAQSVVAIGEYIIPKVHCDSNKRIPNTAESSHCSKSLRGGFHSTSHVPIP